MRRLAALLPYFSELGFEPQTDTVPGGGAALLGGRYCSILGNKAAQLRFTQAGTGYQTVFQVPDIPGLERPVPFTTSHGEHRVRVWREAGLLKVRVSPAP